MIYSTLVRSVSRYASPVWAALLDYFSDVMESVQKKTLHNFLPQLNYVDMLALTGLAFSMWR